MGKSIASLIFISNDLFRPSAERAAIHEAVEIAKRRGHKGIAGMVNGVLRSIQREGVPSVDEIKDPVEQQQLQQVIQFGLSKNGLQNMV